MTSPSPLDRLAGPGNVLAKELPDAKEFAGLVRSGLARLKDAENESNSLESRFDLAYGAAHALCLAALRHHGYRPSKRYIVFQLLPDTLSLGPDVWRVLSKCHDMRNRTEYEGVMDVDDRLVTDLISAILAVADGVVVAAKNDLPDLVAGAARLPPTPETAPGNFVILDIGRGAYAMYAHLKPASVRVVVGGRVKRGQVIGLLGNSGNSRGPHLHFQIQDTPVLSSEGLPYAHESFDLVGQCELQPLGRCERKPPVTRRNEIPLNGMLVQFAPVPGSRAVLIAAAGAPPPRR